MAEKNMRLRVILDLADKALAPLKRISQGSADTAKTLKAARDQLKKLNEQQAAVGNFEKHQQALRQSSNQLKVLQQNLKTLQATGGASTSQIKSHQTAIEKQTAKFKEQQATVFKLRSGLNALGISNVSGAQQKMAADIAATTSRIKAQTDALKRQADEQRKLSKIQQQAAKGAAIGAGMSAAGAASIYAGRQLMRPVQSAMGAYAEQENASSQLSASMMLADGSVSKEFAEIDALAKRLGDRLPGTTADFLELQAVLKQQGLTDKTILGGTGEAAALLGVQLRMNIPAAGEFAAKMQDATRTAETDMLSLMDTIQRGYYMGVDSNNMLQGFSKMSPVMSILRKEGLEFSNMMAPLLVMMDQTGMAGESAGNAIRKVFQGGLDLKKLSKANALLKDSKAGFKLNFTDKNGAFLGMDNVFAQLEKLKGLGDNAVLRTGVMKALFGDDSETMQVLNTMMDKGKAGYEEVAAKMAAQASLQQRVEQQLGTFSNVVEAAQGSATNALASIGEVMAPDLKNLVNWLGEAGGAANAWIKENQTLVRWLGMGVMALAAFMAVTGALLIPLGLIVAKGMAMRWIFAKVASSFVASGGALGLLQGGIARLSGGFGLLLRWGSALFRLNPFAALAAGVFGFAQSFVVNWDKIKAAFNAGDWSSIGGFIIQGLEAGLNMATLGLYGILKSALSGLITAAKAVLGIHSPSTVFAEMGAFLIDGLIVGIGNKLAALKNAVVGAATSAAQWFKEKLGIASPSKVFTQFGGWISEGAAKGIEAGQASVRAASVAMAAAALAPATAATGNAGGAGPAPTVAAAPVIMAKAPAPAAAPAGGNTYTITIQAAPGADPNAIAHA
ncbi:MAG: phage tail tape measure protein, partial [Comamonas sp.]|nr:phage tail tape measure protein [Comamonas sp.]